jgi:hypothetical protein
LDFSPALDFPTITRPSANQAQSGSQVLDISRTGFLRGTFVGGARQSVSLFAGESGIQFTGDTASVMLSAYAADNTLLTQTTATVSAGGGFHTPLTVRSASPNIAYFTVTPQSGKPVALDDVAFDTAGSQPQPDFYLAPWNQTVSLLQGGTTLLPLTINRLDGSTGPVQLSASGLPSGIQASFTINPATTTSTLILTASPNAALTGLNLPALTVTAAPQQPTAGPMLHSVQVGVQVRRNYWILVEPNEVYLSHCGDATATVYVYHDPGFAGTVNLSATGLPAGVTATFSPPAVTFTAGSPDHLTSTFSLTAPSDQTQHPPSLFTVIVHAVSGVLPESTYPVIVHYTDAAVNGFNPTSGSTPTNVPQVPGTLVTINGVGFCVSPNEQNSVLKVQFGNDNFPEELQTPSYTSPDGTQIQVRVPRLAMTGPLKVIWPNPPNFAITSQQTFTVSNYRNTNGFSFVNPTNGIDPFSALSRVGDLFGICGVVQCVWGLPTPFPNLFGSAIAGAAPFFFLQGYCFGVDLASQRLLQGAVPFSNFPPGTPPIYGLQGPGGPSDQLLTYLQTQHLAQFSDEVISAYFSKTLAGYNADDIYNQIVNAILASDRPIIAIHENIGSGHVLVPYDIENVQRDYSNKVIAFDIDVYDPNRPFLPSENTDQNVHRQRVQDSRIHISPVNHWTFLFGPNQSWEGGFGNLAVIPYTVIPVQPHLPGLDTLLNVLKNYIFGDADTTQVADNQGHTLLLPDGRPNDNPATRLPQAALYAPLADGNPGLEGFLVGGPGPYTETVRGARTGQYTDLHFGHGFAVRATVPSSLGVNDQMTLSPQSSSFRFHTDAASKAFALQVAVLAADQTAHTATLHTTSYASGNDTFAFDASGQAFTYTHLGAAVDYQLTLTGFAPDGTPANFVSALLHLNPGDQASFRPADWGRLDTVALTVTHPDGSQTTSTLTSLAGVLQLRDVPIAALRGQSFSGAVATFTDQRGPRPLDQYFALINWGDGSAPTRGTVRQNGPGFDVLGQHTYAREGSYPVRITLQDNDGDAAAVTATATVTWTASHFRLDLSGNVTAGSPVNVTVTALDQNETRVPTYRGTVHFTSSDGQAMMPADYTFTAADSGVHTFAGGVTLRTAGGQTVTASDMADPRLAGSAATTVTPILFGPPTSYSVGQGPLAVVTADLNGDGIADLVTINPGDSTISVLLGNGDGSWTFVVPEPKRGGCLFVTTADVNGDGIPDLIESFADSGQLAIQLGNGDGTFRDPVWVDGCPGCPGPITAVKPVYLNGTVSLVTVNYAANSVSALAGNADGTFQPAVLYSVGQGPTSVDVGDLNGDGIPDLVVANNTDSTFSVLLGNGDGTFRPGPPLPAIPPGPCTVALADVNHDGVLDLLATHCMADGSGRLSVWLGRGDGTFTFDLDIPICPPPLPRPSWPWPLVVGDFNGDGNVDFAVANYAANTVWVGLGAGDGSFALNGVSFPVGQGPIGLVAGDFNGDGLLDLAVANSQDNTVSILLNQQMPAGTGPASSERGGRRDSPLMATPVLVPSASPISSQVGTVADSASLAAAPGAVRVAAAVPVDDRPMKARSDERSRALPDAVFADLAWLDPCFTTVDLLG